MPETTQKFLAPVSLSTREWKGTPFWKKFTSVQNPGDLAPSLLRILFWAPPRQQRWRRKTVRVPRCTGFHRAGVIETLFSPSETHLSLRKNNYRANSWVRLKTGTMENILIDFYNCAWLWPCSGLSNVSTAGFLFHWQYRSVSLSKHLLQGSIKGQFWPSASALRLPSVKHLDIAFLCDPFKNTQALSLSSFSHKTPIGLQWEHFFFSS